MTVTVERSEQRAFDINEYAAAGCRIVAANSWPQASPGDLIIGLKEPPEDPFALSARHAFFAHAYKGQRRGPAVIGRFRAGGGTLFDLEYLTDDSGRRVAAFGFWAGYVGAALAVLRQRADLGRPLTSTTRFELRDKLRSATDGSAAALVIGASGRAGRGARQALAEAALRITEWDVEETKYIDRSAVIAHDIVINAVCSSEPGPPFLTDREAARADRRLTVLCDVTCDVDSAHNRLPVNDQLTDWERPTRRLGFGPVPLDVIAINNLPSMLPRESSTAFSAELLPNLALLPDDSGAWERCLKWFYDTCRALGLAADLTTRRTYA